jgi:hypothetical protein
LNGIARGEFRMPGAIRASAAALQHEHQFTGKSSFVEQNQGAFRRLPQIMTILDELMHLGSSGIMGFTRNPAWRKSGLRS